MLKTTLSATITLFLFFVPFARADLANLVGEDDEPVIETCDSPKGTVAIAEPQNHVLMLLTEYSLPAPTSLLRSYVQKSNCFQVVERGRAMQNIQQERDLAQSGMLQQGSNMGGGQMVTADFVMTPDILFKDNNAGGAAVGAAIGSLFGGLGSTIGAVAGGVKIKEAETSLLLADVRSGLQVASGTGTYKKTDWAMGGILGAAGGGAYTSTDQGKVVAGALLDNYNMIVRDIKAKPSLLASTSAVAQKNAKASLQATRFSAGDLLHSKLNNLKVYESADKSSGVAGKVDKSTDLVYLGESESGFLYVQGADVEGWVQEVMMQ